MQLTELKAEIEEVPILDRPEERSQLFVLQGRSIVHVPILDRPEERSQF